MTFGPRHCMAVVALLVAAGCGGAAEKPADSTPTKAPAKPVVLKIKIADGKVTPRGARVNLKVGQPLHLSIESDIDADIHVHSEPEKYFDADAGEVEDETLVLDQPGKVAIEVHQLEATVAEVLVRP